MVLIVAYDLHQPGRDYSKIQEVLQSADSWAHPQGSVWLLDTLVDPSTWRDRLSNAGDPNDEYFVGRLHERSWASWNMDRQVADWLKSPSRRW